MCSEMLTWLYNSEPSGKPSQSSKTTEPCDFSETSDSSNECGNDSDTVTATVTLLVGFMSPSVLNIFQCVRKFLYILQ